MFNKEYSAIDIFKIIEIRDDTGESRYVDNDYSLYIQFIADGGIPTVTVASSASEFLEVVANTIQYKSGYAAILLARAKAAAKVTLYNNRVTKDYGGTTIGGITLATDEKSQAILSQAYVGAKNGLLESGSLWKTPSGYVTLTKADIITLYEGVFSFIKTNFETEKTKSDLVDACETVAAVEALDLSI